MSIPNVIRARCRRSVSMYANRRGVLFQVGAMGAFLACTAGPVLAQTTTARDSGGAPASAGIVLDGVFDDWSTVPVALVDGLDAPKAEIDFGEVRIAHDERFVHLLIYQSHEVNLQRLDGRAQILFDADGDTDTGEVREGLAGVDVIVTFSPPNQRDAKRPGMGVGAAVWSPRGWLDISPYELGISFAPTYASRQVEFRIERAPNAPALRHVLASPTCTVKLVLVDGTGTRLDETEVITHDLRSTGVARKDAAASGAMTRAHGTDVRIMSWNTRFGSLVQQPELARRIIRAIDPDVVLLQEQTDANTAADIAGVFNGTDSRGDRRYSALLGAGGGDLRSALVARMPIERVDAVEPIPYPYWEGRFLRACGGAVEVGGRRMLFVSSHLKCCGKIGDRSDVKRETEAHAIRTAVRAAQIDGSPAGVVVAGDLNLVGGRRPLEILIDSIDVNGSDLAIAQPMQLDGLSNATWADVEQPFVAGRLDYVLFSDSTMRSLKSFVFDTADLDTATRAEHGLEAGDAMTVSDHLPVVVDLQWRD